MERVLRRGPTLIARPVTGTPCPPAVTRAAPRLDGVQPPPRPKKRRAAQVALRAARGQRGHWGKGADGAGHSVPVYTL